MLTNASLEYCQLKLSHRAKAQEKLHEQRMELGELEDWLCGRQKNQNQAEHRRMENRIRTLRAASDASESMVIQVVESQRWMWTIRHDLLPISVIELVDEGIAKMQNLQTAAETPPESNVRADGCGSVNELDLIDICLQGFAVSQEVRSSVNRNNKRPSYIKPDKQWKVRSSGNKFWYNEFFL